MSYFVLKRLIDICIALAGILLFLPAFLVIIILTFITDEEKSIIFKQKRFGKDRVIFYIYKLRTMNSLSGEITQIGKILRRLSIDEMPQFVNVIKGDMSIVGPRPMPVDEDLFFRDQIEGYDKRNKVLPGLTGLAQSRGNRGKVDVMGMRDRVQHDLEYVDNASFITDLSIIVRTIFTFFYLNHAS